MKTRDGLFIGLLLGAGLALLYAPKSGKEVREEVREKLDKIPKNFFGLAESLLDLSLSVLEFAKEAYEEQSEKITSAFNKGLDIAKDKTEELKAMATSISKN